MGKRSLRWEKVALAISMVSFLWAGEGIAGIMDYAPGVSVSDITTSYNSEKSRIVIESPKRMEENIFTLSHPSRVVIDLKDLDAFEGIPLVDKSSPLFRAIRTSERPSGDYRIVVDTAVDAEIESTYQLIPTGGNGFRLVVDVKPSDVQQSRIISQNKEAGVKAPALSEKREQDKKLLIVVDAGHGAKDPGAIGPSGLQEKDVVLSIALKLAQLLDASPHFDAVLTRRDDTFLPLRERTKIARRHQADFFVSIHADAFTSPRPKGPSVFALSERGASSESARWLMNSENAEPIARDGEILDLSEKDEDLAKILLELTVAGTISESKRAGESVLAQLATLSKPHKPRVEQAAFVVLKSPDIPSLLVEAGFLTNPEEEKHLAASWYQQRVAERIFKGLEEYRESRDAHHGS